MIQYCPYKEKKKRSRNIRRTTKKMFAILGSLEDSKIPHTLRASDYNKYRQYLRTNNALEKIKINGILSNEFLESVHNRRTEQSTEIQSDNIENQQIDQEVHVIDDIE